MKIGVLGAGTWGTALATLLVKNGHDVTLWSALEREIDELRKNGSHRNLPGAKIPEELKYTTDVCEVCMGAEMVLFVVASEYIRRTAALVAPHLEDGVILVSAAKGIERGTLMTMTDIIEDEIKKSGVDIKHENVALSGPTHAEEVARGMPTSVVSACEDEEVSMRVASAFSNSCMRVYTNTDILGVEIAGAFKNIIAIASGINRGMGFGDNSQAMLMTRGMAEMTRIGLAMGCKRRTFMGLAGIGDLIVTCTSVHSRNNRCGELIGAGMSYADASAKIGMVVEGYYALEAAMELKEKYGVEMPITTAVYNVLKRGMTPHDAMLSLMNRDLKSELV
ncbi:MAG: NAD(P)-dependent glycerol-3-phosphate dehydrogenase [Clostridia bacterium]|nr:NAD(P)-dependent glycerol-3-phosphate dehydrogenase [Clostridia bacterium]